MKQQMTGLQNIPTFLHPPSSEISVFQQTRLMNLQNCQHQTDFSREELRFDNLERVQGYNTVDVTYQNINKQQQEKDNEKERKEIVRIPSVFHNFQKHLITTLRSNVTLSNLRKSSDPKEKLACCLWEFFLNSKKPAKRYLYSLLSSSPLSLIQFQRKSNDNNQQIDFYKKIMEFDEQEVQLAQAFLRFQIVKQCKILIDKGLLRGRRMTKIQQFNQYFRNFVNELENGEMSLRMPKKKKRECQYFVKIQNEQSDKGQ